MDALKTQLNTSRYKSVECKFGNPMFGSLDATNGSARVQAELKIVYEHAFLAKPEVSELIAEMTFVRPDARSPWQIDSAQFKPK
jgi:hypothetical protein